VQDDWSSQLGLPVTLLFDSSRNKEHRKMSGFYNYCQYEYSLLALNFFCQKWLRQSTEISQSATESSQEKLADRPGCLMLNTLSHCYATVLVQVRTTYYIVYCVLMACLQGHKAVHAIEAFKGSFCRSAALSQRCD
jgi:hypothetical protein